MVRYSGSVVTEVQLTVTVVFANQWVGVCISNARVASGAAMKASKLSGVGKMSVVGKIRDIWGVREE